MSIMECSMNLIHEYILGPYYNRLKKISLCSTMIIIGHVNIVSLGNFNWLYGHRKLVHLLTMMMVRTRNANHIIFISAIALQIKA